MTYGSRETTMTFEEFGKQIKEVWDKYDLPRPSEEELKQSYKELQEKPSKWIETSKLT